MLKLPFGVATKLIEWTGNGTKMVQVELGRAPREAAVIGIGNRSAV